MSRKVTKLNALLTLCAQFLLFVDVALFCRWFNDILFVDHNFTTAPLVK